jgi:hypothetical protein
MRELEKIAATFARAALRRPIATASAARSSRARPNIRNNANPAEYQLSCANGVAGSANVPCHIRSRRRGHLL